jgi:diguanylate cyclase (GGDEF)-like protein
MRISGALIKLLRRLQMKLQHDGGPASAAPPPIMLDTDMESRLRVNERIWAGFREIELRMLAADTLHAVIEVLVDELPVFFPGVHAVSIAWLDADFELSRLLEQQSDKIRKLPFIALSPPLPALSPSVARLGPLDEASQQHFFPHTPHTLRSMALVPLVLRRQRVGSLNQASSDLYHFTPDKATHLLEHLAAITAICIDAAVNRARLQRDGFTDMLTQVANRRFFDRRLREEVSQWLRREGEISCLLVDLDRFKQINDTHGHQSGDQVLQAVAAALSQGLRVSDVLARYGGEEFVLLLPETGKERAVEIAERLRSAVARVAIKASRGQHLRVTASFGVASLHSSQHATLHEPGVWLIRQADQALYRAKAQGRNCVMANGDKP